MARPTKVGLDYFSLDVAFDDNVELMEAECGLQGFAILIKLWQKIYSEGYYIEWKEDNAILFSRKINSEITLVNSVVNSCLSRKIFSRELYESYKILTSKAIQKRYLTACKQSKRANVAVIKEYLLVNSELTQVISELTSINSEFSTQSKVKESKVKESKEEREDSLSQQVIEILNYYGTLKPGQSISAHKDAIRVLIDMYSLEWVKDALQETIKQKGKFIQPYMEKILQNWQVEGKGEHHGSSKQNPGESQGKYSGLKLPEPKIGDIDTTDTDII